MSVVNLLQFGVVKPVETGESTEGKLVAASHSAHELLRGGGFLESNSLVHQPKGWKRSFDPEKPPGRGGCVVGSASAPEKPTTTVLISHSR